MRPAVQTNISQATPKFAEIEQLSHAKGTVSPLPPSDGMILVIGPRLEGHLPKFTAVQTHPFCRFHLPSISPASTGARLRRSDQCSTSRGHAINFCLESTPEVDDGHENVRFWGNSGHRGMALQCLLLARSAH